MLTLEYVLTAALMFPDCRICVWNAADGSLVHSLTGHSESVSGVQKLIY